MSKKLKLYRQSGAPVNLADRQAYDTEWKAFYDKSAARAGLDMLKLQRYLSFGERQLTKKHNVLVEVALPQSSKAWTNLIKQYEDCPIMVARSIDGSEIVAILMDTLGQG